MRFLSMFTHFDLEAFLAEKTLIVTGVSDWFDYEDKSKLLGSKISTVIYEDNTIYGDYQESNRFERLVIKVPKRIDVTDVPLDSRVVPINGVAKIWGEHHSNLSITADDIEVID